MANIETDKLLEQAVRHHRDGKLAEAEELYRQVLARQPNNPDAMNLLGALALHVGQFDLAIALIRRAIEINPKISNYHYNLGLSFQEKGMVDQAIAAYQESIRLKPDVATVHNNLGNVLRDKGLLDQAMAAYDHALRLQPGFAPAHNNIGNALYEKGLVGEAIDSYRQALRLDPKYADAHNNIGNALRDQGLLDEAIDAYRQAVILNPDYAKAHSSLVYSLHYHQDYDARMILAEHLEWDRCYAEPLRSRILPHTNDRSPERRLRIGYISPDLRNHSVGRFLFPLISNHNPKEVEIHFYSGVVAPDELTDRFRAHSHAWRNIHGLSDEQTANLIRRDGIDILVDLSMHSANNRLLVMAPKPAPVQVSYLAYCSTTGLKCIDYRLTDPYLDPPGQGDECYSEKSIRLPDTWWCYQPPPVELEVSPLPAIGRGQITFACLNNFSKVSPAAMESWRLILREVPASRLILHVKEGSHRRRLRDSFSADWIDPDRVEFVGQLPAREFLGIYHAIDICLDPFPCAGGTTTCDALWMGVPVITMSGRTAIGRTGVSILSNLGLTELVAKSPEEYLRIGVDLANDLGRLESLRNGMRERMLRSPLMDGPRLARNVEAAFRVMWRTWCPEDRSPLPGN